MRFFIDAPKIKAISSFIFCLVIIVSASIPQAEATETLFLELKGSFDISALGVNLDVAVTETGQVYIASPSESGLMLLQNERKTFSHIEIKGIENGYFFNPSSVETDKEGRLWIANPDMHEILVCDTAGELITRFNKGHIRLERPEILFPLADGKTGAWDTRLKMLFIFSFSENRAILKKVAADGRLTCIQDDSGDAVCFDSDHGRLEKIRDDATIAETFLTAEKGNLYPKIQHMETGPGNYLYVTDSANKQLRYFSSDLKPEGRFPIYEHLFVQPAGFTFRNNDLWLIDEGRKELMHFVVRSAVTGIEHVLLGEEYLALGHFQLALREIEAAKEMGYSNFETLIFSGKARYGLGRYDDALADFTRAKDGGDLSAYFYMGNTLFRLQRYAEAETAFSAALEIGKHRELVLFNIAQTLMAGNRFKDAETFFASLLSENPDHFQARSGLSRSFMEQGRFEKAMKILIPLEKQKGVERTARHDLGICFLMTEQYEKAIPLLKRSAAEGPFYKEAFEGLEKAYRMTGDAATADQYRRKAEMLHRDRLFTPYLLEDAQ